MAKYSFASVVGSGIVSIPDEGTGFFQLTYNSSGHIMALMFVLVFQYYISELILKRALP
jgi:hypothetical protein